VGSIGVPSSSRHRSSWSRRVHVRRNWDRMAVMRRAGQIAVRLRWLPQLVIAALFALVWRCGGEAPTPSGGDASLEGSDSSTGGCSQACDFSNSGLTCCNGQCRNLHNDPRNCGGCGVTCSDTAPFCGGHCEEQPCDRSNVPSLTPAAPLGDVAACDAKSCCGSYCCSPGQICCALSANPQGIGCYTLQPGENSCPVGCPECRSDRNLKRDVEAVDTLMVLEAVAQMPILKWSYTNDDPAVRHMGPMAQDFKLAFGLGDTDQAYYPIDAHGVAFAAIQALFERTKEEESRIERLERLNAQLRAQCRGLHVE
jgi:Chaperone of endosialidase/Stigma-specific protein, Stig1